MVANGCVSYDNLISFLQSLREERASQMTEEKVYEAVINLNKRLERFNMMVRSTCDDKTHERFYSLISTVDNDITRRASHHTEKEFEFFRLVWQELQNHAALKSDLCKLGPNLRLINQEQLIDTWCNKHWLVEDDDGVRLGPRAKAELDVLVASGSRDNNSE